MAVWGTPIALEDDAERAVRAALDLVAAGRRLGDDAGAELQLRAGVLDRRGSRHHRRRRRRAWSPATSSTPLRGCSPPPSPARCWSTRPPGGATEAAIEYRRRRRAHLKGKREPVAAVDRAAGRGRRGGGEGRAAARGPVRRPRPRASADEGAVHATAEERRAQLVSIVGIAGIGKCRLAWEFEKHIDGLVERSGGTRGAASATATASRSGRWPRWCACAPGSREDDSPSSAGRQAGRDGGAVRPRRRGARLDQPRLAAPAGPRRAGDGRSRATVLGMAAVLRADGRRRARWCWCSRTSSGRMQALLDFIEYLMEWSRDHPLLVVTLARPELFDRRARAGSAGRGRSRR